MKILDRYIIKQMALHFLMIIIALAALYLLVDIFERLDNFQERQLPATLAVRYFLLKLPFILDQIGPVSLLLAGIITLGLLMNHRELQSLNAAGISTLRVMKPFAGAGMLFTLLGLAAAQWLLPASGQEVERIWHQEVLNEKGEGIVRQGVTFFRGREGIYTFEDRDKNHKVLSEFRYQEVGGMRGVGQRTLYAGSATYKDGLWRLQDGQVRTEGPTPTVEPFTQKTLALPEKAMDFFAPIAFDFEQPISSLAHRAMERQGPGHRQSLLDLDRRLSFLLLGLPLLCLALPVILCFELGRTGVNLALAIPVSAGLAFLVWGLWSGLQAMAQATAISTIAASWSIHLLCLAGGAILMGRRS